MTYFIFINKSISSNLTVKLKMHYIITLLENIQLQARVA